MATPRAAAGEPPFGRPVRNPLSLLRVDAAIARLAAVIGVAFFLQSIPLLLRPSGLANMDPVWSVAILAVLIASLVACGVAAILKRGVRVTYVAFAVVYLIALVSWPFAVLDVDVAIADNSSYWLYFLLTIATTMAAVAMELPLAVLYTVGVPVIYGLIRITEAGGETSPELALLDSVYSILLGGGILILIVVLRSAEP